MKDEAKAVAAVVKEKVKEIKEATETTTAPVSANAFASGSSINGPQVMTGRPTSRVLAPPGGVTSWTL